MLDDELLAKYPPDDKQRFNRLSQVGQVLDQLLNAPLELHLPDHPDLEAEVAQSPAQVVLDGDSLRLQQLAVVSGILNFWLRNVFTCRWSP